MLYLPFVALKQVMCNFDPFELAKFASISRRCRAIVKSIIVRRTYTLSVYFMWPLALILIKNKITYRLQLPYEPSKKHPLDKKQIEFLMKCADAICDIFKCNVHGLHIYSDDCLGYFDLIVNWIHSRQISVDECFISGDKVIDTELEYLIHNCKINKMLFLEVTPNNGNRLINQDFKKMDYLHIRNRNVIRWITLNDIISFDCIHIDLGRFNFSEADINRYLKEWINGCNPRMKYLHLVLPHLNIEALTAGIQVEHKEIGLVRTYHHSEQCTHWEFNGGSDIRRKDGSLATFQQDSNQYLDGNGRIVTIEYCFFRMVVW